MNTAETDKTGPETSAQAVRAYEDGPNPERPAESRTEPHTASDILAANTERCAPEAARQITAGQLTTEQWQQTVRMTAELMHTLHTEKETK